MDGEAAEDSHVLTLAEDVADVEVLDGPESVDILEGLEDGGLAVLVRARPGHEFLEVGIIVAEGHVDGVGRDEAVDDLGLGDALEEFLNDFNVGFWHRCFYMKVFYTPEFNDSTATLKAPAISSPGIVESPS